MLLRPLLLAVLLVPASALATTDAWPVGCTPGAPIGERGGEAPPALTLAGVYRRGLPVADYWVSEKLDGVRAYWDGRRLVSRGGRAIVAPAQFTAGWPRLALDGELWMGRGTFDRLSGIVRRQRPDPDAWRAVRYMVFDLPGCGLDFDGRLAALRQLFAVPQPASLQLIEQWRGRDHAHLMMRLRRVVAAGGEGLMLHRAAAPYRAGRGDDLLKLKPYLDAEARVIAHLPGKGRLRGMVGALLVEDAEGRRFRLGSGLSDAERQAPPPIGSWVTFRYQGYTGNGIPRFARYLRVRTAEE
ncbi:MULTISPECIES: DNA ligase [unclassified Marichromatium]|uniref:DNA ligase n=1 Tax=unclassified Marichromatium TaxID=2618417 RepID=UPI000F3AAF39|nr:DNA ligase [Marichromatium sp. AB31]RNE92259.1 DNA ligase [Marichromatium sp. AB31]